MIRYVSDGISRAEETRATFQMDRTTQKPAASFSRTLPAFTSRAVNGVFVLTAESFEGSMKITGSGWAGLEESWGANRVRLGSV